MPTHPLLVPVERHLLAQPGRGGGIKVKGHLCSDLTVGMAGQVARISVKGQEPGGAGGVERGGLYW